MKTKLLKIAALVVAVALIIGVCIFANSLIGNPISKALAKNTAEKHIQENYDNTEYKLEDVSYSFKDGYYHAYISSENSIDGSFTLLINGFGKLKYDNFEYNVTNGWNTATRLDKDYRNAVQTLLDSNTFPYNEYIGYGELVFVTEEQKDDPLTLDYALITDELVVDAYYNVNELGAKSGKLTVCIEDENVSAARMAEILIGIRQSFDDAGIGFYAIDCTLDSTSDDGRVEVIEFLYSDIYEDGLVERVEAAIEASNEFYGI